MNGSRDDRTGESVRGEGPERFPTTSSHVLASTRTGDRTGDSKWIAYAASTRAYLRSLGVPASDLDDLAQDAIVRLVTDVIPRYQRSRGPFRPYYKQALRNLVATLFRSKGRRREVTADTDTEVQAEAEPFETLENVAAAVLTGIAAVDRFVQDAPLASAQAALLLRYVLIDGERPLSIADRYGIHTRSVRRVLHEQAVPQFLDTIRGQLGRDPVIDDALRALPDRIRGIFRSKDIDGKRSTLLHIIGGLLIRYGNYQQVMSLPLSDPRRVGS